MVKLSLAQARIQESLTLEASFPVPRHRRKVATFSLIVINLVLLVGL